MYYDDYEESYYDYDEANEEAIDMALDMADRYGFAIEDAYQFAMENAKSRMRREELKKNNGKYTDPYYSREKCKKEHRYHERIYDPNTYAGRQLAKTGYAAKEVRDYSSDTNRIGRYRAIADNPNKSPRTRAYASDIVARLKREQNAELKDRRSRDPRLERMGSSYDKRY